MRDSVVSVLMSPKFCYRIDLLDRHGRGRRSRQVRTAAAHGPAAVRLRAGQPAELLPVVEHAGRRAARPCRAGDLHKPEVLVAQARRMLKDDRASAGWRPSSPATGSTSAGSRSTTPSIASAFPSFTNELREAMFEEPVRFIEDVIRNDRSVLDLLYGNYTFVNPVLAKHYGMPAVAGGARQVGARGRRAAVRPRRPAADVGVPDAERARPADQPGEARLLGGAARARRDDPAAAARRCRNCRATKRNWICRCARCWPSTGRTRPAPLAMRGSIPSAWRSKARPGRRAARPRTWPDAPVETEAAFPGGSEGAGFEGVQTYIREHRQKDFVDNLSRKLLAYALGRSLMLSDEPAVERMQAQLTANGYRFSSLVETIVTSPQFLNKRSPIRRTRMPTTER